jgi:hypothetical protein
MTSRDALIASPAVSKKLEQKQQRRLAEEQRRKEQRKEAFRRNAVTIGVALLVIVLVVVAIVVQRSDEVIAGDIGVPMDEAGCDDVLESKSEGRDHLPTEGAPHAPYETDPPTSGPHYEIPADLGFYTEPLAPEQLVHNLEHGQIVIWYRPDLPSQTIDEIEELVNREAGATVAVPYENLASDEAVVFTAWTASQRCEELSEEALIAFRRDYQGQAPEPITPPYEG